MSGARQKKWAARESDCAAARFDVRVRGHRTTSTVYATRHLNRQPPPSPRSVTAHGRYDAGVGGCGAQPGGSAQRNPGPKGARDARQDGAILQVGAKVAQLHEATARATAWLQSARSRRAWGQPRLLRGLSSYARLKPSPIGTSLKNRDNSYFCVAVDNVNCGDKL